MAELFDREMHEWLHLDEEWDGTRLLIDGKFVPEYVSTYSSIGGPKAVLMTWDEEDGMYSPWNTWFGAVDPDAAWKDAKNWALSEDIPAVRNAA